MKRVTQVIKLKPELATQYLELHANPWKSISDKITECNIKNYSIYRFGDYLFSYYDYDGTEEQYKKDMDKMCEHKESQVWWALVNPCQEPVEEAKAGEWWHDIEEIFHQD